MRLISNVDSAGILLGTKVDLSDGDYVWGDLATHRCADRHNFCCCHARSDDSGYLSEKPRSLHQLLPTLLFRQEQEILPLPVFGVVCGPASMVKRQVMGNETGLPDKTSAATHATEEDDVRTL